MIIKEDVEIHAPLPVVWQVFSCVEDWDTWNSVCRSSCYVEGSEMSAGACMSFVLRPFPLPIRISPRITKCEPGREIVWEGERFGIRAEHTFTFREEENTVILASREVFWGPMVWLSRLLFVPSRLHRLTRELLTAIKAEAENRHLAACS